MYRGIFKAENTKDINTFTNWLVDVSVQVVYWLSYYTCTYNGSKPSRQNKLCCEDVSA